MSMKRISHPLTNNICCSLAVFKAQAVGAADKVFELMYRQPKYRVSTTEADPTALAEHRGISGITAIKTAEHRLRGVRPPACQGQIVLNDVELYYPARPQRRVLKGLSMEVKPGSVVALVGQSGGGKSSVMSLIQHLYDPSAGKVLLDGVEVSEISPTWLSQNVSIVSQEPTLFARSVKRNIMYGLEGTEREPTDEEIKEAARLANAASFIESMPNGYDAEVGEVSFQAFMVSFLVNDWFCSLVGNVCLTIQSLSLCLFLVHIYNFTVSLWFLAWCSIIRWVLLLCSLSLCFDGFEVTQIGILKDFFLILYCCCAQVVRSKE